MLQAFFEAPRPTGLDAGHRGTLPHPPHPPTHPRSPPDPPCMPAMLLKASNAKKSNQTKEGLCYLAGELPQDIIWSPSNGDSKASV